MTRGDDLVRIQGFHAVKHGWRFGARLEDLVAVDPDRATDMARRLAPDLVDLMATARAVTETEFAESIGGDHPTGVGAVARRPTEPTIERLRSSRQRPVVFLEDPRRLGNVGSAIRTTAALGGAGVYSSGTVDPWHERAIRASAGLHFAIDVGHLTRLPDVGERLVAFDAEGDDLRELEIPENAVLAFGTERHGISDELRSSAAAIARIPMAPGVSSLNLATAVSIGLFAWLSRSGTVFPSHMPGSAAHTPSRGETT